MPLFVYKLIGIALIFAIVGGTIYAGYRYVENLQAKVEAYKTEVVTLDLANKKLSASLEQQKQLLKDRQVEIDAAQAGDESARKLIYDLELKLNDKDRQDRRKRIEQSRKASLYLKFIQNYEKCLASHFDDFSGKCNFRGKFVIPKEPK